MINRTAFEAQKELRLSGLNLELIRLEKLLKEHYVKPELDERPQAEVDRYFALEREYGSLLKTYDQVAATTFEDYKREIRETQAQYWLEDQFWRGLYPHD